MFLLIKVKNRQPELKSAQEPSTVNVSSFFLSMTAFLFLFNAS